jgi:hypothetical protein
MGDLHLNRIRGRKSGFVLLTGMQADVKIVIARRNYEPNIGVGRDSLKAAWP